jgi:hypothetical protein
MICVHCHQDRCCYGRGLCGRCYYEPGLREQYPLLPHPKRPIEATQCKDDGLTAEDVERIVAEQSACLPDWFYQDMRALGKEVC